MWRTVDLALQQEIVTLYERALGTWSGIARVARERFAAEVAQRLGDKAQAPVVAGLHDDI